MWIQTDIRKNSSQIRTEEKFDTEVERQNDEILVTFRFDGVAQSGGKLCVSHETARWLAYALLATAESSTATNHLFMRVEDGRIVTSGPVQDS